MEKDLTNNQTESQGKTIRELLIIIRNNLWLVLAIIFIFISLGVGYSVIEKPSFTASRKLIFTCENTSKYNGVSTNTTQNNFSTMNAYAETIMDFCDEGVVIDRANRYYVNYLNNKSSYKTVEDYIKDLEGNSEVNIVNPDAELSKQSITVKKLGEAAETQFAFQVQYTEQDSQEAYDKLKILVYAFEKEVLVTKEDNTTIKYFGEFKVYIEDLGSVGVVSNTSKTKNLMVFGIVGVVIAFFAVYIKMATNNTITTKDELEKIVGAPVFAAIENVG